MSNNYRWDAQKLLCFGNLDKLCVECQNQMRLIGAKKSCLHLPIISLPKLSSRFPSIFTVFQMCIVALFLLATLSLFLMALFDLGPLKAQMKLIPIPPSPISVE
jgi:hypothetical protein